LASTTFVDNSTPIIASWLNDVNIVTYTNVPALLTSVNTTIPATYVSKDSNTGAADIPSGTTAQRPAAPTGTKFRYNSTLGSWEGYNGSTWGSVGGGATGGGSDKVFVETSQNVTADYTLTTGFNAVSAGPLTVASGITVTVPTGAAWTIV